MLNPTYKEMAAWYRVAVNPARAYKPRDKAKIDVGVLIAGRWILARLRHCTFFSLAELNAAIRGLVRWLNQRPFKMLDGCRRSLVEEIVGRAVVLGREEGEVRPVLITVTPKESTRIRRC